MDSAKQEKLFSKIIEILGITISELSIITEKFLEKHNFIGSHVWTITRQDLQIGAILAVISAVLDFDFSETKKESLVNFLNSSLTKETAMCDHRLYPRSSYSIIRSTLRNYGITFKEETT
jgi:hypothetical protein